MMAKPTRSLAQELSVSDNWVIVLLKLMYLNTYSKTAKYTIKVQKLVTHTTSISLIKKYTIYEISKTMSSFLIWIYIMEYKFSILQFL